MKKIIISSVWLLAPLLISGCNSDSNNDLPVEVTFVSEFNNGADQWIAGFSDYPVDDNEIYQLVSGIQEIPEQGGQQGYLTGGMNRSDDLFMYLKREVTGLVPNTRYSLTTKSVFWSEAGDVCFGIGGSPGGSVFMKIGASEVEPVQADYYMNIDIGHQSNGGVDAKPVGNISIEGLSCYGGEFGTKEVALSSDMNVEIISSAEGSAWVIIGSDSGYEGQTHLYYESVAVTLTPIQ